MVELTLREKMEVLIISITIGILNFSKFYRYFEKKKLEFLKSIDKPDKNIKSLSERINFNKLKQEEMHK